MLPTMSGTEALTPSCRQACPSAGARLVRWDCLPFKVMSRVFAVALVMLAATGHGTRLQARANRLTLSETHLRFPQKTDDLLCRVAQLLPKHSETH